LRIHFSRQRFDGLRAADPVGGVHVGHPERQQLRDE